MRRPLEVPVQTERTRVPDRRVADRAQQLRASFKIVHAFLNHVLRNIRVFFED